MEIKPDRLSDGEWEDVPDLTQTTSRQTSTAPSTGSNRGSARRRTTKSKPASVAYSSSSRRSATPRVYDAETPPRSSIYDREQVQHAALSGAFFTVRYARDVLSTAVWLLKKPLGVLLFLWILGIIFTQLTHTFRTVFSPLCIIPGISRSFLCYTPPNDDMRPKWANYTQLMDMQSSTFEQLMDGAAGGSGLSLEIKKAEMATSDLVTLIRVSDLKSKELLADTLNDFVEDAKATGRGLQTLSAKIGGAVDSIMAVNDYAMHAIEAAHEKSQSSLIPWPFNNAVKTQEVVLATFHEAMDVLARQVERTVLEAELNLAQLERLEQHLLTIKEIISREDASISTAEAELLAQLWTKLGGNQRELRGHQRHLALLRNLGAYRARARAHIAATLHSLQALSADMEELRERAAAPQIVGARIPVEVHMKSIRGGIERLKEGQRKARGRQAAVVRNIMSAEDVNVE